MSDPMPPAVPDPTVEALSGLLDDHGGFRCEQIGDYEGAGWLCWCGASLREFWPIGGVAPQDTAIMAAHRGHLAAILTARAAAPDALRVAVEAVAYGEAASAVLNGVVGTTPDTYGGVTKDEALEHAGELLTDLRALLEETR